MLHADIRPLLANTSGRDFVIADLHGKSNCLTSIMNNLKLSQQDRLFIAGDLVDRGEDSVGVIEAIIKAREKGLDIHVIKGNHEQMTLNSIKALFFILTELTKEGVTSISNENLIQKMNSMLTDPMMRDLKNHIEYNGGQWLLDLFVKEYTEGKIPNYTADSKIKMIEEFMSGLPYIISVAGTDDIMPFNVVHADMPFSDLELKKRIQLGIGLRLDEKDHAIWAREEDFDRVIDRLPTSIITYCGHNIVGAGGAVSVRRLTSMVNLDGGAYFTNVSLVTDHTSRRTSCMPGSSSEKQEPSDLQAATKESQRYLQERHYLNKLLMIMRETIQEMSRASTEHVSTIMQRGIDKINQEIINVSEHCVLPRWSADDFLRIAHSDAGISSSTMLLVNQKLIGELIERAKHTLKTEQAVSNFKLFLLQVANLYNQFHRPETPLDYRDQLKMLDDLVRPHTVSLTQSGLFSHRRSPAFSGREEARKYAANAEKEFVDSKLDEYRENIDPDKAIKDVTDMISRINNVIQIHNEGDPDHPLDHILCEKFYNKNEDELFCDANRQQALYLKSSFQIQDLKNMLLIKAGKSSDQNEIAEEIKSVHQKIMKLVHEHNPRCEIKIKPPSLSDLEELVSSTQRLRPH